MAILRNIYTWKCYSQCNCLLKECCISRCTECIRYSWPLLKVRYSRPHFQQKPAHLRKKSMYSRQTDFMTALKWLNLLLTHWRFALSLWCRWFRVLMISNFTSRKLAKLQLFRNVRDNPILLKKLLNSFNSSWDLSYYNERK